MRSGRIRVCLAASGGGHFRQLLDLRPFWEAHDTHFVTEATALAATVGGERPMHFVPHYRLAQLRPATLVKALGAVARNAVASWRAVRTMRPQLVISTGAGAVFFAIVLAKLFGARFVLIESFARVTAPSAFGRVARRLADVVVVQSEQLKQRWPEAEVFDPLKLLGPATGAKEDLGLITVGTLIPFDRLVQAVADLPPALRPARIVAQVGAGGIAPARFETRESLSFIEMGELLDRASVVFCHGGSGSLVTALRAGCRVVAMPRRQALGENNDDHQLDLIEAFSARGLIEAAYEAEDVRPALERALAKVPQRATTDHAALIKRLDGLVRDWFPAASRPHPDSQGPR